MAAQGFGGLFVVQQLGLDDLAEYFGVASEQVQLWLRTEKFGRFGVDHRWSIEDAERMYQELDDAAAVYDLDAAAELITEVRRVAEIVRAYGDTPYERSSAGINASVPAELHVIAAKLETALRGVLVVDEKNAASLESARRSMVSWAAVHAHGATVSEPRPGQQDAPAAVAEADAPLDLLEHFFGRSIPVVFGVVDSICPPAGVSSEQRCEKLRTAWERLGTAATGLRKTLGSAGRGGAYMLSIQRGLIAEHLETVESAIGDRADVGRNGDADE